MAVTPLSQYYTKQIVRSLARDLAGVSEDSKSVANDTIDNYIWLGIGKLASILTSLSSDFYGHKTPTTVDISTGLAMTAVPFHGASGLARDGSDDIPVDKILTVYSESATVHVNGIGMSVDEFYQNVPTVSTGKYTHTNSLYTNTFIWAQSGDGILIAQGSGHTFSATVKAGMSFLRKPILPAVGSTGDSTKIDLPDDVCPLLVLEVAEIIQRRINKPITQDQLIDKATQIKSLYGKFGQSVPVGENPSKNVG